MPVNYAQDIEISCPHCKYTFQVNIWLILSESEQPPLIEQVKDGTLNDSVCPCCGHISKPDARLLILCSDPAHPLLFSPTQSKLQVKDFQGLIGRLQQSLGADWNPEWMSVGVTIPRPYLATAMKTGIEAALSLMEQDRKQAEKRLYDLIHLVSQFINIENWLESKVFLYQHPELLEEETLDLLEPLIHHAQQQGEKSEQALHEHKALLQRCREVGIEAAYQEKGLSSWPEEIAESVSQALQAKARYELTEEVESLRVMVELWEKCLTSSLIQTLQLEQRLTLLVTTAIGFFFAYQSACDSKILNRAIENFQEVIDLTPLDSPNRVIYLSNLGEVMRQRYTRTGQLEDLDAAIRHFQETVDLSQPGSDRAMYLNNLGKRLRERYISTGQQIDLDAAIGYYQEAVNLTRSGPNRADYLSNLGNGLSNRYARTSHLTDLEAAIQYYQEAVNLTPSGSNRADHLNNLGNGLRERYDCTGQLEDLEASISYVQEAVDITPSGLGRAMYLNNLGNGLHDRYTRTSQMEDLEAAIRYDQEAVDLTPSGPNRAIYLSNLGNGLRERYVRTGQLEDLDASFLYWQQALDLTPAGPNRASRLSKLGSGLSDRYASTGQLKDLEAAIRYQQQALDLTPSGPDRASYLNNLGNELSDRYRSTGQLEDLAAAIGYYRQACQTGQQTAPAAALKASRNWGAWALERASWAEAVEALTYGRDMIHQLYRHHTNRADKEAWLREAQGLPAYLAYALVQCNKLQEAVETIESGTARLLAEALNNKSISPGQSEQSTTPASEVSLDYICQAAASNAPLVYLLFTPVGGMALIVTANQEITPLHLTQLTTKTLRERIIGPTKEPELGGYLGAYARWRFSSGEKSAFAAWQEELKRTTSWLWQAGVGQLVETLKGMRIEQVVMLPSGLLGLLPLHAARQDCDGRSCYALDEICFRYAPNAQSLLGRKNPSQFPGTLLAIDNPDRSLLFSADEVEAAASHFAPDCSLLLRHAAANLQKVLTAMPDYEVLHFSTHGIAGFSRPLNGLLILAEKQELTLQEVMDLDLAAVRLVVLSACETGIPGMNLPDEVISLPTGFMQAGAAGVVGSLWAVNDLSTMLLMRRFYELWLGKGMQPWQALREAQIWLRSRTKEQWQDLFESSTRMSKDVTHEGLRRAKWDEVDFSHPFYWAAFGYLGQ